MDYQQWLDLMNEWLVRIVRTMDPIANNTANDHELYKSGLNPRQAAIHIWGHALNRYLNPVEQEQSHGQETQEG